MIKILPEIVYALCEIVILAAFLAATGVWVARLTGQL